MQNVLDERGHLASQRDMDHFLAELGAARKVEIDQHTGMASASLQVARESSQRAMDANERGEYIASSASLEIGVTREQAKHLVRIGARYLRGPESAP